MKLLSNKRPELMLMPKLTIVSIIQKAIQFLNKSQWITLYQNILSIACMNSNINIMLNINLYARLV